MKYIYCFENKINHHKYIGQTNNPTVRYTAHKNAAYNSNSKDYGCLFHQKIREYGIDNFDFYILEIIEDNQNNEHVDFREQFWIEQEKSWARYGQGYNQTTGGTQYKKSLPLSDTQLTAIRNELKNTEKTITEIANDFGTYRDCISYINKGIYGFCADEHYPLRVTREWREIPQEVKYEIALLLRDTEIPYKEIMQKYQVSEHFLCQLNNGQTNLNAEFTYPLRKKSTHLTPEQEQIIYDDLKEGKKIMDIARKTGISRSTISKRKKKYNF